MVTEVTSAGDACVDESSDAGEGIEVDGVENIGDEYVRASGLDRATPCRLFEEGSGVAVCCAAIIALRLLSLASVISALISMCTSANSLNTRRTYFVLRPTASHRRARRNAQTHGRNNDKDRVARANER